MAGAAAVLLILASAAAPQSLPGTSPLTAEGDLAARMLQGMQAYLTRETAGSVERRQSFWKRDFSSRDAYERSVGKNRERLRSIIGVVDQRVPFDSPQLEPATQGPAYQISSVRWPVLDGIDGAGLLLQPNQTPQCNVVVLPDADGSPEQTVSQFAGQLAAGGCRVLVPVLISRRPVGLVKGGLQRPTNQPHREFIYRMAFEVGRHIIGYEVQQVLAAVDWFSRAPDHPRIGVMGYGEGGSIALYSAAVDTRIDAAVVSGYFQPREGLWQEPVYHNVWGLLHEFGDAELAGLVAPRTLMIEASRGPQVNGPPPSGRELGTGAAPGNLSGPLLADVQKEYDRARPVFEKLRAGRQFLLMTDQRGRDEPGSPSTIAAFLQALGVKAANRAAPISAAAGRPNFDSMAVEQRQLEQLIAFTQKILRRSESAREQFWSKADTSSLENWKRSREFYRQHLWEEIFGKLPAPSEPMKVQTRQWRKQARWTAHEVLLPLWPEVFAYGVLLVPNDLKPGERRPAVVAQHGRAGRPVDLIEPPSADVERVYKRLAAQLADQGFVVYAPQNPYIFEEQYRYVQRKANPLKLSLFSFILSQHQRTLDWLSALPFVDPSRIAYYGLSYGGKTAVRVPPLLDKYALSICSADFNEYSGKMAAIDRPDSFMYTIEHEMYEFNLANTFNYSDMVRLMAPRGFMVERGHNDGVGLDEWVAYEYEKVRRFYAHLGIPQRTEIEFFDGGHEIHGVGTFRFLREQLNWRGEGQGR